MQFPKNASPTLSFVPDAEEITLVLMRANPMPFDDMVVYEDRRHKYAFVYTDGNTKQKLYVEKGVVGVTTMISEYLVPFEKYSFPNSSTLKKMVNSISNWEKTKDLFPPKDRWDYSYQDFLSHAFFRQMRSYLDRKSVV
jgi:hypothetical protein